jgi:hypothetical protein
MEYDAMFLDLGFKSRSLTSSSAPLAAQLNRQDAKTPSSLAIPSWRLGVLAVQNACGAF